MAASSRLERRRQHYPQTLIYQYEDVMKYLTMRNRMIMRTVRGLDQRILEGGWKGISCRLHQADLSGGSGGISSSAGRTMRLNLSSVMLCILGHCP